MQPTDGRDPYQHGSFIPRLSKSGILFASDLDGTLSTGEADPSIKELDDREGVLDIVERIGAAKAAVSARSRGLMMDKETFEATQENGLEEFEPQWHLNQETGKHEYVDPAAVPFFRHHLNWDMLGSLGSGILIKNGKGYLQDKIYDRMLKFDYVEPTIEKHSYMPWRNAATMFVFTLCSKATPYLAGIEFFIKYRRGEVNVAPLPYRMQFNFKGTAGLRVMRLLRSRIEEEAAGHGEYASFARRLQLVDESRLHEDPEQCVHVVYLLPWYGRKENMINRLVSKSAEAAGRMVKDIRLFYAGDTLTDLRAGLYGGGDAQTCFLLATGSRLAPYLIERRARYGSEDLSKLWAKSGKAGRTKDRLCATGERGVYRFEHKFRGERKNLVVIGDERYPHETPPGSVKKFLEEFV